jgi:hypothetical protein
VKGYTRGNVAIEPRFRGLTFNASKKEKAGNTGCKNNYGFKQGIKPPIVGKDCRDNIRHRGLLHSFFDVIGGDMGACWRCRVTPIREIRGPIK